MGGKSATHFNNLLLTAFNSLNGRKHNYCLKMAKQKISGMTTTQLDYFLNDTSARRDVYQISANEIFQRPAEDGFLSKESFLSLYASWTESEKDQIENLLTLIRNGVHVNDMPRFGKNKKGEYGEVFVENEHNIYTFRIYAPVEFLAIITPAYISGAYDKPNFTLQELYQEASK